ncbi:hypothetical protein EIP86_006027 [Pleurotus ostreatoroseus]|nr:hypothetical protein EIP86_006027 [Pleurotus ostreatoroseus]
MLEILVRPPPSYLDQLKFDFPVKECPALTSLRRLDWWHHNDAARSGGLNSLTDVLKSAPNIVYLSLGGDLHISPLQHLSISLPSLVTLHIRPMNASLWASLGGWRLPSLRHVIIDTYNGFIPQNFWSAFGHQVKTVELGQSIKFCLIDMAQYVLGVCPNLEELNYRIQFAATPNLPVRHPTLTTVRLHAASNGFFADEGNGFWQHIESHFIALSSTCLPALKHVVLHGDWGFLLHNNRSHSLMKRLLDAGRRVELID